MSAETTRDQLFTGPEVALLLDRERSWWIISLMFAIPVSAIVGFGAGIWFATHLYGGQ